MKELIGSGSDETNSQLHLQIAISCGFQASLDFLFIVDQKTGSGTIIRASRDIVAFQA